MVSPRLIGVCTDSSPVLGPFLVGQSIWLICWSSSSSLPMIIALWSPSHCGPRVVNPEPLCPSILADGGGGVGIRCFDPCTNTSCPFPFGLVFWCWCPLDLVLFKNNLSIPFALKKVMTRARRIRPRPKSKSAESRKSINAVEFNCIHADQPPPTSQPVQPTCTGHRQPKTKQNHSLFEMIPVKSNERKWKSRTFFVVLVSFHPVEWP